MQRSAAFLVAALLVVTSVAAAQAVQTVDKLSQADLEEMLGPIALYPDALIANILAATIYPDQLTKASQFVASGGKPDDFAAQKWEPPVQAVAQIPQVLSLLADNLDWATAIGQAYLAQPQDVTTAIQSLRTKAQNNGVLQSNDQQTVVQEGQTIIIEPAQEQVIYVPQYNPEVVYVDHYNDPYWPTVAASAISFGAGAIAGWAFHDLDCDWHNGHVVHGDWNRDVDVNRNIDINDIDRNNRPRPGNEGQRWTPNRDKMNLDNGRPRTDKMAQFKGDQGRTAVNNLKRPTGGGPARVAGAAPTAGLRKVSPPAAARTNVPTARATGAQRPAAAPARAPTAAQRPAAPSARPAASNRTATPSAFNRTGASSSSYNRGAASRSRPTASRGSGGSRGSASGGRAGGGRGGGRR